MYLTDYHMHSICSPDGTAPFLAMAQAAQKAGLSEICLTDHCDLLDGSGRRSLTYDWAPVLHEVALAEAQLGERVKIQLGIELGGANISPEAAANILAQDRLDFVIASVHNYSEESAGRGIDFYFERYTSEEVCRRAVTDYLSTLEQVAKTGLYDVIGHITYIQRYATVRDGFDFSFEPYFDHLSEILRIAIEKGGGIELNTWCGRTVEELRSILRLYKDLGGEIVTVGSDAHHPENVGKGVRQAYDLLRDVGFSYIATYEKRKPVFHRLGGNLI